MASPVNDMFADAALAAVLQAEQCGASLASKSLPSQPMKMDRMHFKASLRLNASKFSLLESAE